MDTRKLLPHRIVGFVIVFCMLFSGYPPSPVAAAGVTWYVATTGSDANSCLSSDSPCLTINGAIGKAASDDIIRVAVGTYTGSGDEVVFIDKNITLSGGWNASFTTQSEMSTIDGQGARRGMTVDGFVVAVVEYFVIQNGVADYGGGISNPFGTLTLNHSIFMHNMANYGGGIYFSMYGELQLYRSTVSNNTANYQGGGIYIDGHSGSGNTAFINYSNINANTGGGIINYGYLNINNSAIHNNTGVGIYNHWHDMSINNSTISNNSGLDDGGGIYHLNGNTSINNSTISGNSAVYRGGGISAAYGTVNIKNSTIGFNLTTSIVYGGGGIYNSNATINLKNTLVAKNSTSGTGPDCSGDVIISSGHNLIGNNSGCTFNSTTGDLIGTSHLPIDPHLTPLQDNGGDTLTHALKVGSLAIDSGNPASPGSNENACLATDQRGIARPIGNACDIGAFEGSIFTGYINLLQDPSFEAFTPNPHWVESSTNFGTPLCTVAVCGNGGGTAGPRTGSVWGWFGGVQNHETASLSQTIHLPGSYTNLKLQFYFRIGSAAPGSDTADVFTAKVDGVTVFSANATQQALYPVYTPVVVDISAFANGNPHTITFSAVTSDQVVNFNLDDISLTNSIFFDVPMTGFGWAQIESIYNAGITGGCSTNPLNYCPNQSVTRAQMAVFLLRGIFGSSHTPPSATGTVFNDVPLGSFAAAWIEQMVDEGITAGCGGGNFCPNGLVTRAQMAVFLLRAKHGSGYTPPPASGTVFTDVPSNGFAAAWIEQLVAEGITSGCGGGNYCPNQVVTRAQMAIFLQRTFNLPMP